METNYVDYVKRNQKPSNTVQLQEILSNIFSKLDKKLNLLIPQPDKLWQMSRLCAF